MTNNDSIKRGKIKHYQTRARLFSNKKTVKGGAK